MTIEFYTNISLSHANRLVKFIDFIDKSVAEIPDDGPYSIIRNHEQLPSFNTDQYYVEYPDLFNDLQTTLGIEQKIIDLLFWKFLPDSELCIHKDGIPGQPIPREHAITIPIQNCDKLKINWYEDKDPALTKLGDFVVFRPEDPNQLVKVHECYLTNPVLIRIDKWHNAKNEGDAPAYFISIRLHPAVDVVSEFVGGP